MQASITSAVQSITAPVVKKHDGCLLLQVDRGLVISINSVAALIWKHLEQNLRGLTLVEVVDYVEQSCSESPKNGALRTEIERDVGELLRYLEKRQFIKRRTRRNSGALYQTVQGVLTTQNNVSATRTYSSEVPGEAEVVHKIKRLLTPISKDPSLGGTVQEQIAEINSYQSKTHTLIALLTFAAYDMLMKLLGFHRMCRIITRGAFRRRRVDLVRILQVCAGVERARIWYPKQIMCMQHSAVITFLLARCGLNARLAIAGRSMPFQSHAWVELDGIVLNDTQKVQQYYKVFTYLQCELKVMGS